MIKIKYLLSLNRYSRNGKKMTNPRGIVLHHAENEGYGAIETRNYFDNLRFGKNAIYYSTHYIVGFNGEIIYCVPEDEIAYHRGNCEESDGYISIMCCNSNNAEEPCANSLISLKALVRDIAERRSFDIENDFLRHYDTAGIRCPLFYVENDDKWRSLKQEIQNEIALMKYLTDNSQAIAEKASKVIGVDKSYLTDVLEGKTYAGIELISKIVQITLNGKQI